VGRRCGHARRASRWLEALLIQAAALVTATSAAGLPDLYRVIKPLPMLIAIFLVATYDPLTPGSGQKDSNVRSVSCLPAGSGCSPR
jgi:hypothetical protein